MRLLDLGCGAGGAAMGYHRAGFEVTGVDVRPQPRFPFTFVLGSMLEVDLDGFDVIHASPPCQRWSALNNGTWANADQHPDLIGPMRARLTTWGGPWIIENVPGSPLRDPLVLCGTMFGLRLPHGHLRRHRLFEISIPLHRTPPPCDHRGRALGVYGHGRGGGPSRGRSLAADEARTIMGISWATRDGVAQAVPPAYTEWIGRRLLEAVR